MQTKPLAWKSLSTASGSFQPCGLCIKINEPCLTLIRHLLPCLSPVRNGRYRTKFSNVCKTYFSLCDTSAVQLCLLCFCRKTRLYVSIGRGQTECGPDAGLVSATRTMLKNLSACCEGSYVWSRICKTVRLWMACRVV